MTTTLEDARDWLRDRLDDGEKCPCCSQFAKVYRRKLTGAAAHVLIRMYRTNGKNWAYVPGFGAPGGDALKARYWGLIEERPDAEAREDGSSRTGWWRLTDVGEAFLQNRTTITKYAHVFDSRCLGFDGDAVTIIDALGTGFNYRDLMAGT